MTVFNPSDESEISLEHFPFDTTNPFDVFVFKTHKIVFSIGETALVVAAFTYAAAKMHSAALFFTANLLSMVGGGFLGVILPNTIGRLKLWKNVGGTVRTFVAVGMISIGGFMGLQYTHAVKDLVRSQVETPCSTELSKGGAPKSSVAEQPPAAK